ncbi:hypothetical protein PAPYR_11464 [Paratrimastix pyriformis]|uniref:Uncharacterized protein n=1 Tax=Paratrimastix pyriformis TaxID=342808 RepID=A0ABQ8UAX3_9EUKA|nr:hypothetical protein PAPYR_11464 [Paratrimastix pyriformis]
MYLKQGAFSPQKGLDVDHRVLFLLPTANFSPGTANLAVPRLSHTPQTHRRSHEVSGGTRPAHQIPARPPPCFLQTLDVLIFSRAANFFLPWCLPSTPVLRKTFRIAPWSNQTRSPCLFSAPFDIHMYVDPDPPEVPPLNPNDPEYPSE